MPPGHRDAPASCGSGTAVEGQGGLGRGRPIAQRVLRPDVGVLGHASLSFRVQKASPSSSLSCSKPLALFSYQSSWAEPDPLSEWVYYDPLC